jgi:hypothetical protein
LFQEHNSLTVTKITGWYVQKSVERLAVDWMARVRSPAGQRTFILISASRPALGPTEPPVQRVAVVLSVGGVMLTTHPLLERAPPCCVAGKLDFTGYKQTLQFHSYTFSLMCWYSICYLQFVCNVTCLQSVSPLCKVSIQSVGRLESSFRFLRQIVVRSLYDENEMNKYSSGLVCLSAWFGSRNVGLIWVKFGVDLMPLGTAIKL